MSKRESKRRINRRSKAYKRAMIYINLLFICFIVFFFIFGALHTFTHKKDYRNEGIAYYQQGEYETALDSFDKALACNQWFSNKMNADIELYRASCYMELYDYVNASLVYNNLEKKYSDKYYDKEQVDFMILLTENLQKFLDGDYISTSVVFCDAVDKGFPEMSLYAGECFEAQEDFEQMKAYYDIYNNHFGMNSFLYYKYATYYIINEDYNTALSYVNDGINSSDQEYIKDILFTQIICYEKQHDYEKAFSLADDYVTRYPDDKDGADMYAYLDTRVNLNEKPVNNIFNDKQE